MFLPCSNKHADDLDLMKTTPCPHSKCLETPGEPHAPELDKVSLKCDQLHEPKSLEACIDHLGGVAQQRAHTVDCLVLSLRKPLLQPLISFNNLARLLSLQPRDSCYCTFLLVIGVIFPDRRVWWHLHLSEITSKSIFETNKKNIQMLVCQCWCCAHSLKDLK